MRKKVSCRFFLCSFFIFAPKTKHTKLMKHASSLFFVLMLSVLATPADAQQQDGTVDVAILCLNDFHGAFVQNPYQDIPGAPSVLQTLDSLKRVYPHHLTVSAGDNFGGSYFYTATKGQLLPVFFNEAGIRISAVGNHEFDDGQEKLADKWAANPLRPHGWDLKYLCANVLDPAGKRPAYMEPFTVEEIRLSPTRTVHVGLVSLLASSAQEQISASKIKGMTFRGDYTRVLDSLQTVPGFQQVEKAEIRALLMHIGANMKDGQPVWNDKNTEELERINTPLYQGFLAGHSHDPVCGHINESRKPITQGYWHGNYISVMKFRLDTVSMQVVAVEPSIVPVRARKRAELTPRALHLQQQIDSLLDCTRTKAGTALGEHVAYVAKNLHHDRAQRYVMSPVARLVCESYADAYRRAHKDKFVVGVSHFGSIRSGMTKGEITVIDVGEVLPFQNDMQAYRFTYDELLHLLTVGRQNLRYGWLQYSNLDVEYDDDGVAVKATYVTPKGKCRKLKGTDPITVVVDNYMAGGGDGYHNIFFPENRIDVTLPSATDCFINYLRKRKTIGEE